MQQKLPPEFRKRFSFCLTFGYDVCEKKMHESQLIPIPYFTDVFNVDAGIGNQKLNKSFYIEDAKDINVVICISLNLYIQHMRLYTG